MKIYQKKYSFISSGILIIFLSFLNTNSSTNISKAEESYLNPMQIDSSTKPEEDGAGLPTNPFQLVEMIRRANSMIDATKPSDAIDDALKAFDSIEQKD